MNNEIRLENGLKPKHQQEIEAIIKQQKNVESVWLFGSRAMGTYKDSSDIDLVVKGSELTLSDLEKILTKLELTTIPYKVDILIKHKINNPELLEHIEKFGIRWI